VCSAWYRSFWHERSGPAAVEGATVHPKAATHSEIKTQLLFWWVMHAPTPMLRHFGFTFTPRELELHLELQLLLDGELQVTTRAEHDEVLRWLDQLRAQNERKGVFDRPLLSALLDRLAAQVRERQVAAL